MSYHNTNNLKHEQLFRAEQKAKSQDVRILEFFEMFKSRSWTPSEVWETVGMKSEGVPLTSTRRAMSNLVKQEKLIKTETQKNGLFGKPEHYYIYFQKSPVIHTLF